MHNNNRVLKVRKIIMVLLLMAVFSLTGCSGGKPDGQYTADTWYQLSFSGDSCIYSNAAVGFTWKGTYTMEGNILQIELTDNGGNLVEKEAVYDKESATIEMEDRIYVKG